MGKSAVADQRTMTGKRTHVTIGDVESYWRAWAAEKGFKRPNGSITHDLTTTKLTSPVYVSAGQYVADCPLDGCNGAAACWVENDKACCLSCGTVFSPKWPTKTQIGGSWDDAVALLAARADPRWRNFRASNPSETIADLKVQNLAMGDEVPGLTPAIPGPHPLNVSIVRS